MYPSPSHPIVILIQICYHDLWKNHETLKEIKEMKFSQMPYERPDLEAVKAQLNEFNKI